MFRLLSRKFNEKTLKEVAWNALEEYKQFIFEVDSINTWLERIMRYPKPVVLQAYTNWSIPCRKLIPILEKKALLAEGKWAYCRLDIEELPDLASGLQVSIVPTLFLLNRGHSVNRIEGMPTEEGLNQFLDDALLLAGLESDETVFKGLLLAGKEFFAEKKYDEAIKIYAEAMKSKDFFEKYKEECLLGLGKALYHKGETENSEKNFAKILQNQEAAEYFEKIQKAKQDSTIKDSKFLARVKEIECDLKFDQNNFELQGKLAFVYHEFGYHAEALDICISLIALERNFKGFGQKAAIFILNNLGPSHILTKPTRKRLQQLHNKYSV